MIARELTDLELEEIAQRCRRLIVKMGHEAGAFGAHYGPALSLVEIMTAVYGVAVRHTAAEASHIERDRVILSKGHGSLALYSVLHESGFINDEQLLTVEKDGSALPGQPMRNLELGIEFSSGSLGMGLAFGVGLALSAGLSRSDRNVYVIMGDGETNEGSVWEAAMSGSHFGLRHLTAIIDVNDLQSDGTTAQVMSCRLADMWRGFGWEVTEVDGHSVGELRSALSEPCTDRPRCILARTVKGKGVSFMEGAAEWHHGRLTESQFETAWQDVHHGEVG